ncbi:MAG TPA: YoaK family protein [Acidimicrobiales bacterium]|jgi:uncharacterized membrane protein YoaK (UPF0700 family)
MARAGEGGGDVLSRMVLAGLFLLAATTGMVDATTFLGLGRVFTANMTGNVLLLGFSSTTRPDGYTQNTILYGGLAALLAFVSGALLGAAVAGRRDATARFRAGFGTEWVFLATAAVLLFDTGATRGGLRYVVLVLFGLSMGFQSSVVRRMGVPDINTTVLTTTMAGLASDVVAVAGRAARVARRVATVAFLFLGAALGAVLEEQGVRWSALGALAALSLGVLLMGFGGALRPGGDLSV